MRRAYICGPYTAPSNTAILMNCQRAINAAADVLSATGMLPIIPHTAVENGANWEDAMARCRHLIRRMSPANDVLVVLPGWEDSKGSRQEVTLAMDLGIRVQALSEVLNG